MWCLAIASAAVPPLSRAGEVPEPKLYAGLSEEGGRVAGRWRRRRDAEFELYELSDGTVVRWIRTRGTLVQDHLLDAAGQPSVTVTFEGGAPRDIVAHGADEVSVSLVGWAPRELLPGATLLLPDAGEARPDGGLRAEVLGGRLEVWREEATDPTTEAFVDGLLAGSGGELLDRSTTWIDGLPAVRFAVQVGPDLAQVWAWPLQDATLVLAWRVPSPDDPVRAIVTGRILPALVQIVPGSQPGKRSPPAP